MSLYRTACSDLYRRTFRSMLTTPPATVPAPKQLSRFVFTLNNYTESEVRWLRSWTDCTWLIFGKEVGEEGTSHLQGACILNKRWRFPALKKLEGFRRAHIETMRGRPSDSKAYCSKEDPSPFEFGIMPVTQQGKRSDLAFVTDKIRDGSTLHTVAKEDPVAIVKFFKGLTVLRSLLQEPRSSPPKVYWIWGPTGVGKTRSVFEFTKKYGGGADQLWISACEGLKWFDGYDGQQVAVFDDFRAKHCSFPMLLRLLDRYPVSVPIKGAFVNWIPKYIFITCPYSPNDCFATRKQYKPEDLEQLHRRITKVSEIEQALDNTERMLLIESWKPQEDTISTVLQGGTGSGEDSALPESTINLGETQLIPRRRSLEHGAPFPSEVSGVFNRSGLDLDESM